MKPTVRGILIVAAGGLTAILPSIVSERLWPLWVAYLVLAVVLLGIDLLLAVPPSRIHVEVECPEILYIGEAGELRIRLRIAADATVPFEGRFDLSEGLEPAGNSSGILSPEGIELRVPLAPTRRGDAEVETLWLRYSGPLGLIERSPTFRLGKIIAVVPNVRPTRQTALRFLAEPSYRAGLKVEKYKGDGTEFDSIRAFVEGDDRRAIHWRSSARHRTLLCRQYRAERNHQVILAVDTGHLMSDPLAGGIPKVDHAVTAALLLSYVGLRTGDRVGFLSFDAALGAFLEPRAGMAQFRQISRISSQIEYSTAETNFTLGLTALGQKLKRRSLVVLLTDFVDTVTAELMVENLGRLARTHLVVFVTLSDPQLSALARTAPSSVLELNRAVVAAADRREREVVLKRLRRLGLFTIDADPARVQPALINRYLEIKRRELV